MRAFGVVEAVLGVGGVEVLPSSLEVRRYVAPFVDMDSVLPGCDRLLPSLQIDGDGAAVRPIREAGGTYWIALRVLELCCSPRSLSLGNLGRGCGFPGLVAAFLSNGLAVLSRIPGGGVAAAGGLLLLLGRVPPLQPGALVFGARCAASSHEAKKQEGQEQKCA